MLFGHKTVSWFDVWSIEHFVAGITLGTIVVAFQRCFGDKNALSSRADAFYFLLLILMCAYFWETLEHYIEIDAFGWPKIAAWFHGVEYFPNRMITDPIMLVLGAFLVRKWQIFCWPARIFSVAWLVVHIFIFPHSMWLHTGFW